MKLTLQKQLFQDEESAQPILLSPSKSSQPQIERAA